MSKSNNMVRSDEQSLLTTGGAHMKGPRAFRWAGVLAAACAIGVPCCGGSDSPAPAGQGGAADASVGGSAGSAKGGSAGANQGGSGGTTTGGYAGTPVGGSGGSGAGGSAGGNLGGSAGAPAGGSAGSQVGGSAGSQVGGSAGSQVGGSAGSQAGGSAGGVVGGSAGVAGGGGEPPDASIGDASDAEAAADVVESGPSICSKNSDCNDNIACTLDSCTAGVCYHWPGPNSGATACPASKICSVTQGCVQGPVCATTAQCEAQWVTDPCKSNVQCDGVTSTCKFVPLDKDNDGHPPLVCGGDDCDDTHATVYGGATEVCDQYDNNCDGQVNEGLAATCGDLCPTLTPLIDCSTSCGGPTANCVPSTCAASGWVLGFGFPAVFRTPSQPGVDPGCDCGLAYVIHFQTHPGTAAPNTVLRITVGAPWKIFALQVPDNKDWCVPADWVSGCMTLPYPGNGLDYHFAIGTSDPTAVARNALLELVPASEGCP